jgi:2-hydroxy-3-keto-5-methylthiopentenyl-1-phosphate phosphatase
MVREAPLDLRRGNKKYNAIETLTIQSISYNIHISNSNIYYLGCDKLFSLTNEHNIPILIFSGGITQLIEMVITYVNREYSKTIGTMNNRCLL